MKLTKAQTRVLADAEVQGLGRVFDVWMGTYWMQGAHKVMDRTAEILMDRGLISLGQETRVFSGRRIAHAEITEAGRAILSDLHAERAKPQ